MYLSPPWLYNIYCFNENGTATWGSPALGQLRGKGMQRVISSRGFIKECATQAKSRFVISTFTCCSLILSPSLTPYKEETSWQHTANFTPSQSLQRVCWRCRSAELAWYHTSPTLLPIVLACSSFEVLHNFPNCFDINWLKTTAEENCFFPLPSQQGLSSKDWALWGI